MCAGECSGDHAPDNRIRGPWWGLRAMASPSRRRTGRPAGRHSRPSPAAGDAFHRQVGDRHPVTCCGERRVDGRRLLRGVATDVERASTPSCTTRRSISRSASPTRGPAGAISGATTLPLLATRRSGRRTRGRRRAAYPEAIASSRSAGSAWSRCRMPIGSPSPRLGRDGRVRVHAAGGQIWVGGDAVSVRRGTVAM